MTVDRRGFNGSERVELYERQDGKCAMCGNDLGQGWHADHIVPVVRDGATELANGQALCARCNLMKGAKPYRGLRVWQEKCLAQWLATDSGPAAVPDFLVSACPGAGKTRLAGAVVEAELASGRANFVVVVVPTATMRRQWSSSLWDHYGIAADSRWRPNGNPVFDTYNGVKVRALVVTYASLRTSKRALPRYITDKTLVIFDEPHHMAEDATWGGDALALFGRAYRRLLLTGTPFRSDGQPIPFVSYDRDGFSAPHYDMSYGAALQSDPPIVRGIVFERMDGEITWLDSATMEQVAARFSDAVSEKAARKRNRQALDERSGWRADSLTMANDRLSLCRDQGDERAGGLVVCDNQDVARSVAAWLTSPTGCGLADDDVLLVTSDESDQPAQDIEAFTNGAARWLVAVRMVSEGVDVPRLRVGVYLTTARTPLYFMQIIGRLIRWRDDIAGDQTAFAYIPNDKQTIEMAEAVESMRGDAVLAAIERDLAADSEDGDALGMLATCDEFICAMGEYAGALMPGGGVLPPEAQAIAERFARDHGMPVGECIKWAVKLMSVFAAQGVGITPTPTAGRSWHEVESERTRLARHLSDGHKQWASALMRVTGSKDGREYFKHTAMLINRAMGTKTFGDAGDVAQIKAGLAVVRTGLQAIKRGNHEQPDA